jgi:hypothetical protein
MTDPFIAAASGLCLVDETFYIVADDDLSLLALPAGLDKKGKLITLFEGALPDDLKERKKVKPDIESIVYLPLQKSLLCLPSGSQPNRFQGALVTLLDREVQKITFKNVFLELVTHFTELNIEGAVILDDKIRLFQRGNGSLHQNAVIDMNLAAFLKDEVKDFSYVLVDLGKLGDVFLSFTDATLHNNECWFLAAAEATESTFFDGEFAGAILGTINSKGVVEKSLILTMPSKPEGIAIQDNTFYFVTDDDDRKKASKFYSLSINTQS